MIYAARIEGGSVAQVTVEAEGYAAPDGWAVVGPINAVGIGWTYDGLRFVPPEQSLDDQDGGGL
ncbi:hypothetical protein QWZ10_02645 [Paracoccus cavernae]|uniref:Uncharacterized protein n=1 Tax=Paracoccus cavernae TaxID=1571207 RepID=A0ABT8D6W0_9RHOB|nr:hypothetical protein [Paracoccus cavernae]